MHGGQWRASNSDSRVSIYFRDLVLLFLEILRNLNSSLHLVIVLNWDYLHYLVEQEFKRAFTLVKTGGLS